VIEYQVIILGSRCWLFYLHFSATSSAIQRFPHN